MLTNTKMKSLTVFSLAMLMTGAIDSIRNLPTSALFGNTLIFFFIFGAIVFLIPIALISAQLTAGSKEQGGIYYWVKQAFGEKAAFFGVWLQWVNTLIWYPTILSFIASTAVYFFNPALAQNKIYLISVILGTFWLMTLINLRGIHVSAKFASFCAVTGMLIPMALIILLALIWVVTGHPLQLHLSASQLIPNFSQTQNWISLTAIITAFLGMELSSVHVKNINNPQQAFPKALFYSVILILITMILGSLSIALVVPHDQINLVAGVIETFTRFFNAYHMHWMIPVITAMLLIGSVGGMTNWIICPIRGMLQAAEHGFLPAVFKKENKHGAAHSLMIAQASIVSIVSLAFLLMPSVNGSYWLLTALSTELYVLLYVLLFIAAIKTRQKTTPPPNTFQIPGGKVGTWLVGIVGLIGCCITLLVGFFPPDGINVGSTLHYMTLFGGGIVAMVLPVLFFYVYKSKQSRLSVTETPPSFEPAN